VRYLEVRRAQLRYRVEAPARDPLIGEDGAGVVGAAFDRGGRARQIDDQLRLRWISGGGEAGGRSPANAAGAASGAAAKLRSSATTAAPVTIAAPITTRHSKPRTRMTSFLRVREAKWHRTPAAMVSNMPGSP
jgi:hypothetical protein